MADLNAFKEKPRFSLPDQRTLANYIYLPVFILICLYSQLVLFQPNTMTYTTSTDTERDFSQSCKTANGETDLVCVASHQLVYFVWFLVIQIFGLYFLHIGMKLYVKAAEIYRGSYSDSRFAFSV
jgi:hypothetical protein